MIFKIILIHYKPNEIGVIQYIILCRTVGQFSKRWLRHYSSANTGVTGYFNPPKHIYPSANLSCDLLTPSKFIVGLN